MNPLGNLPPSIAVNPNILALRNLAETVEVKVALRTTKGERVFKARKLGPVGGRIVAETFAGLLLGDSSSFVAQDPLWVPTLAVNGVFGLRELIAAALRD